MLGRFFLTIIRQGGTRPIYSYKPWSISYGFNLSSFRPLSFTRTHFKSQNPIIRPTPVKVLDSLKKRFDPDTKQVGYFRSFLSLSVKTPFLSPAVITAIGLGGSGGAAARYFPDTVDNWITSLKDFFSASCAPCPCGKKKCDQSPCLHKMDCEEKQMQQAIMDFERAIVDTKAKAQDYTEAAMKAYCEAFIVIEEYIRRGYLVIEHDCFDSPSYETSWCCVYDIAKKRCAKVHEAYQKGCAAWELLCRLREVIEAGKLCQYTQWHPLLPKAEEFFNCAEKELLDMKEQLEQAGLCENQVAEQYKDVIEKFKCDLQPEVDTQKVKLECCDLQPEHDRFLLINAAYKRVIIVQKELAQLLVCSENVPVCLADTCCDTNRKCCETSKKNPCPCPK